MRKVFLILVISVLTISLFSQKIGDKIIVSSETDMHLSKDVWKGWEKTKTLIINDTVKILSNKNEMDYYQVLYKHDTGYVNSIFIRGFIKSSHILNDPNYKEAYTRMNKISESIKISDKNVDRAIDLYIAAYGPPTSRSEYKSGDYQSEILVWNCAGEKTSIPQYHSVTFVNKDGVWEKETEYTSECIN